MNEQTPLLWESVLDMMAPLCSKEDNITLRSLDVEPDNKDPSKWILSVPNKFARDQIEKNLFPTLQMVLRNKGINKLEIILAADPDLFSPQAKRENNKIKPFSSNLNPDYQFHNFVAGPSNNEAFAAAERVSGGTFFPDSNPLLIYGGTGLGKSHLMHAAGNALRNNGRSAVMYMTAEQFVNEFLAALAGKTQKSFSNQLRNVDALLIDDVQFLGGKGQSQAEFFHTFNELFDKKRQIIMTCDRYPKELEGLEARLKSRFGAGLTVSVTPPELETRVAILKNKAKEQSFALPDDVAFFIANHVVSNVRDLEGALKKIIFQCQVVKGDAPATISIAKSALYDLLQAQKRQVNIDNIQKVVASFYHIQISEMLSQSRQKKFTEPRMVAMALTRELTDHSLEKIAEAFKRADHTTVVNAIKKISAKKDEDIQFHDAYQNIRVMLTG